MSDNKTILKLHFEGYSQRKIAEMQKVSRDRSVLPVIKAPDNPGLTLEKIVDLFEDELSELLFPGKKFIPVYAQPDYEYCNKELLKDEVTLSHMYEEYVEQCKSQHQPFYRRSDFL